MRNGYIFVPLDNSLPVPKLQTLLGVCLIVSKINKTLFYGLGIVDAKFLFVDDASEHVVREAVEALDTTTITKFIRIGGENEIVC